jgi:L-ascorbate 6-phosphate lactonase
MGRGEYYEVRLGKPYPLSNLRSEWFDWFLKEVDRYEPKQDSVALWALGGAGFILRAATATIYIDPYVGGSVESEGVVLHRMIPIPFDASAVRKIDATVVTHEDLDHLNEDFIFPVRKNTRCTFIGPSSVAELLESWKIPKNRIVSLGEKEETEIKGTRIIALPSNDANPKTANTYLFDTGKIRFFHSGDSLFLDKFAEIGKKYDIDIAAISLGVNPPGAKWYNEPSEVLQIATDLNAKVLIPMHWDLWHTTLRDPHLVEREATKRRTNTRIVVLRIGQRFDFP